MIRRLRPSGRGLLLLVCALYIGLPLLATLLYSLATRWTDTVLPDAYTLEHWVRTLGEDRVVEAILRSVGLAFLAVAIAVVLVVPAAYTARVRNPRLRLPIEVGALIPFCLPILVIAFGERALAGIVVPSLLGTFPLLLIGHVAVCYPFVYWAVDGALTAAGVDKLTEAAATCGARPVQALVRVVVPNIAGGIAAGAVLALAFSIGEFALAQVLVGASYETMPLWSAEAFTDTRGDFNGLAVVTVLTFALLFVLSAAIVLFTHGRSVTLLGEANTARRR